jgi:8-oxo-dGTP pyrophosphatase MutT (NUDIX family)
MERVEIAMALICQGTEFVLQERPYDRRVQVAGKLGMFGGKVEPGESGSQAVAREISEETTLNRDANDFALLGDIDVVFGDKSDKMHVTGTVHRLEIPSGVIIEAQEGKIARVSQTDVHTLLERMTPATRQAFNKYIIGGV